MERRCRVGVRSPLGDPKMTVSRQASKGPLDGRLHPPQHSGPPEFSDHSAAVSDEHGFAGLNLFEDPAQVSFELSDTDGSHDPIVVSCDYNNK